MKVVLGIKKGMTQVYENDMAVPVTIVEVDDCVVCTKDEKGAEFGVGKVKAKKALIGKYQKVGHVPAKRVYFSGSFDGLNIGDKINPETFVNGDVVNVSGVTKGKGFEGVVKRWGFAGGPKTHGQSDKWRAPG